MLCSRACGSLQATALYATYLESKRAGVKPADGDNLFPQIWSWKVPAFTEVRSFVNALVCGDCGYCMAEAHMYAAREAKL